MLIEFCLPVKNESNILKANTLHLLDFLNSLDLGDWRVVVIVNGSDDDSYAIASSLECEHGHHFRAVNYKKGGKGWALREYFRQSRADVLVFMDVDLAVALDSLPNLIKPILNWEADLVIGSRLLPTSITSRSFLRSFTSKGYNYLSRIFLKHRLSDLQCGFKAIRRSGYKLVEPYLRDDKWFFDTELVTIAKALEMRILEIPVAWKENRYDKRKSKVSLVRDIWSFLGNLVRLRARIKNIK